MMKGTGTLAKATLAGLLVVLSLLVCSTTAFAGPPARNDYTVITDSGATLQPDATPQVIGTTDVSLTTGGLAVTSYTITILGTSTVGAGEVTAVDISDGTNTWSASGSYGPGSAVVCTGANSIPVTGTMTIRVTLDAAAAGKTVGIEVSSEDSGNFSGLPAAGTLHNIFAPADTLSVTLNTPVATSASPGNTDVQMQYLQVDSDNNGNGSIEITNVTVDDIGTAAGGDIDFINVYMDDDANFGNGTLAGKATGTFAGSQLNIDLAASSISAGDRTVAFGTSKYVWITYDVNGAVIDGTQLQSSVTDIAVAGGDSGATGIWNSNNFATSSGPSNSLADCAGCHEYPPTDAGSRDSATGTFVGDHDKHAVYTCDTCHVAPATETSIDFAHRSGTLNMDDGNIGVGADNGTYSKGTGFAQSNTPTTGTCSNVDCHNNSPSPQWGVGTTSCTTCHTTPPSTGAHSAHYTAKTWPNDTANCTVCHPDNTAGHSDVTDSAIIVNAGLGPAGGSPAITCATTGTGCHNGNTSLAWNVAPATIVCTDCHTVGGSNTATVANPVSGLHNMSAAGVQKHDNTISGNACEECHTKASIAGHWDGTASATADYTAANVGISFASGSYTDAGGTGTSRGTCNSTCHADGGSWERQWSTAADSTVTTAGDARCDVCHGQFGNWRAGSSHEGTFGGSASTRGNSHNSLTGAANGCEDCHSYPSVANHEDNFITMNDAGATNVTNAAGRIYCASCHSDDGAPASSGTHTFPVSGFTLDNSVNGANDPVGDCSGCHGGGTAGTNADNYWPDNNVAQTHAGNDDPNGRHLFHVTQIASALYGEDIATLLTDNGQGTADAKQKAVCEYCHQAVTNDGDHTNTLPAEVFPSASYAKFLDGTADGATLASYTTDSCSNVDCHNSKATPAGYGWYEANASACLMCHTVGGAGANPNSGAHNLTQAGTTAHDDNFGSGYGCTDCHQSPATNAHIDGTTNTPATATFNWNLTSKTITLNAAADNTDNTCTATVCHSDGGDWERQWSTAADSTATAVGSARCDVCHGQFNNWRIGTSHAAANEQNRGDTHNSLTGAANGCEDCHVYPTSSGNHNNGSININDSAGVTSAGGRTWCGGCHSDDGAPGTASTHTYEQSTFTRVEVPGPNDPQGDCNACHAAGKSGQIVTSASSHVTVTRGGAFGACTDCHPGNLVGSMHSATGVVGIPNDATVGIDIEYTNAKNAAYTGYAGIVLGGDSTSGSTEADICWNCHDGQPAASEWGTNNGSTYNYGTVYTDAGKGTTTSKWIGTYWTSANFAYKEGWLNNKPTHADSVNGTANGGSTHGINGGTYGVDAAAELACSYCHDVHNTGGGTTGAPYLRGSWTGSPFKEDGAPRSEEGHTWADYLNRTTVPRAGASMGQAGNNEYGGWQTEDNNSYTRAGNTNHGGLCVTCHTGLASNWKHGVVVDGLSGGTAANIFDASLRGTAGGADTGNVRYAYPHHALIDNTKTRQALEGGSKPDYVSGLRDGNDYGDGIAPTAGKPDVSGIGTHVATVIGNVVDADFHQFPCAKCHTPHASRLPRLLITNCLDVRVNTWDDARNPSGWAYANHKYTATELGYSPTSGNCHRYVGASGAPAETGQATGAASGWNTVTPWQ